MRSQSESQVGIAGFFRRGKKRILGLLYSLYNFAVRVGKQSVAMSFSKCLMLCVCCSILCNDNEIKRTQDAFAWDPAIWLASWQCCSLFRYPFSFFGKLLEGVVGSVILVIHMVINKLRKKHETSTEQAISSFVFIRCVYLAW